MKILPFTKMQAAGNDFVLIDNRDASVSPGDFAGLAQKVSDRKFGIGSDGLILLESSDSELVMHYRNPDGSDAGMCGNGARCFVRFARDLGYENDILFRVHDKLYRGELTGDNAGDNTGTTETPGDNTGTTDAAGNSAGTPPGNNTANTVDTGVIIHFPLETRVTPLTVDGEDLLQVYTNTEHVVLPVPETRLDNEDELIEKGRTLRYHKLFSPAGTNVNFMSVSPDALKLQTYERGVENLTLACGTGAIAAALAWHHQEKNSPGDYSADVQVKGGTLTVHFTFNLSTKSYNKIRLEGPATTVFEGTFHT
ncbi:MAG: diaminopimelate epimerase [Balneolaceae bacterium]